jgi:radical SAM superfamily enzyme YgiQ (UPF0313 family)
MKALLVSANTEPINIPVLPLGLACVTAAVQAAGHEAELLNLMYQQDASEVLKQAIKGFQPELIGISVRNIDDQCMENPRFLLDSVKGVVADCRSLSSAPIVLGGAGYSIFPRSALAYLGADMGIQGEGEKAFVTLLERLSQDADLSGIPGLYTPDKGLQAGVRSARDLDDYPLPLPHVHLPTPSTLNNGDIWLPFGFRKFFFVDSTFNLPSSYAKVLCEHLQKAGFGISWRCILYPWKVDEELVGKMAMAGCEEVSLGFESGSMDILRSMNKRFQPEEVHEISDKLKAYGIHRMGFLLLGGPGENKKTVEESLYFADSLGLEGMKVTTGIRIYPYTPLAQTAVKQGLITKDEELLFPTFYMAGELEDRLRVTLRDWMKERPHWQA